MLKSSNTSLRHDQWLRGGAVSTLLIGFLLVGGCFNSTTQDAVEARIDVQQSSGREIEATSLLGEPLYRREPNEKQALALEAAAEAFSNDNAPDEDDFISLGAHYAAAGRYRDAVDIYSQGIEMHPASFKLRRHRAHRFLTLRRLDEARRDLDEAISLMPDAATAPSVELKAGKPNGTYQHWIFYHKGIVEHLSGNYKVAAVFFGQCLDTAGNNDRLIGAVDWLYQSHQKGGDEAAADKALDAISPDISADKSKPYYKRVMIYKGLSNFEEVIDLNKDPADWTALDVTIGYGVASWLRYNGDASAAKNIYDTILKSNYWQIWAYLTAESDIALGG